SLAEEDAADPNASIGWSAIRAGPAACVRPIHHQPATETAVTAAAAPASAKKPGDLRFLRDLLALCAGTSVRAPVDWRACSKCSISGASADLFQLLKSMPCRSPKNNGGSHFSKNIYTKQPRALATRASERTFS